MTTKTVAPLLPRFGHWRRLKRGLRRSARAVSGLTPFRATALRRSHEADVGAARIVRAHEHRLFAGVADAMCRRRHTMGRHPARRGVHATRAVQGLERPWPAPGERLGSRAGLSG